MLRVFANDHHHALTLNDLALFTSFFYGWFHFHFKYQPFLFRPPGYAAFGEIINRNLYRYLITWQDPNIIHSKLARYNCINNMSIWQFDFEGGVWQRLEYNAFKFHYVVLRQNNHSLCNSCVFVFFSSKASSTALHAFAKSSLVSAPRCLRESSQLLSQLINNKCFIFFLFGCSSFLSRPSAINIF